MSLNIDKTRILKSSPDALGARLFHVRSLAFAFVADFYCADGDINGQRDVEAALGNLLDMSEQVEEPLMLQITQRNGIQVIIAIARYGIAEWRDYE